MIDKRKWITFVIAFAGGVLSMVIFRQCTDIEKRESKEIITDTVFIDRPYVPKKIKPNNTPVVVRIYRTTDTVLRVIREKETIIEKVEIKKNEVSITTIDSTGFIKTEVHKVDSDSKLTIDNTGLEEKKKTKAGKVLKKVWKGTKTGLMAVGAVTIAVLAVKHL